jgi:hypothetical protein
LRPNKIQLEKHVTVDVANAATAANLKTAKVFKDQATRPEIHGMLARARRPPLSVDDPREGRPGRQIQNMKTDFLPPTCSNGKPKTVRPGTVLMAKRYEITRRTHWRFICLFAVNKRVNGGGAAPLLYCGDVDFQVETEILQ